MTYSIGTPCAGRMCFPGPPVSLGPAGDRDCSPHRAKQRLSAGRARDHPVMEIVPNKALSLSLRLPRRTNLRQCSLASRRQVWCLLSAAIRLLGIIRGVSFRVRGQSSPHRAKQRLSAGRARDHPVMEIFPNKALSPSLSLRLSLSPSLN